MTEFWSRLGKKISSFLVWSADNHPGKLIGTLSGIFLGLLMAIFGFWRTLVLVLFTAVGFIIGKRQDDHQDITAWLERKFNKF